MHKKESRCERAVVSQVVRFAGVGHLSEWMAFIETGVSKITKFHGENTPDRPGRCQER